MGTRPIETMLSVRGLNFGLAEAGAGGRPFLFVHGFTGAKEDFAGSIEPLARDGWHAVACDLRGHGISSQPTDPSDYSINAMVDDVLAIIVGLGWGQATLLGQGMGAIICQRLAVACPDRVERLIVMDTCAGPLPGLTVDLAALIARVVRNGGVAAYRALLDEADVIPTNPNDPRAPIGAPSLGSRAFRASRDRNLRRSSPAMVRGMIADLATLSDWSRDLSRVSVPTMVMAGAGGHRLWASSQAVAAAIRNASFVGLAAGGYHSQFEAPDEWWGNVTDFLPAVNA